MNIKQTLPKLRFASPTNNSFRFITEEAYSTTYSKSLMTRSKTTSDSQEQYKSLQKKSLKINLCQKKSEGKQKGKQKLQALNWSSNSLLIGHGLNSSVYKVIDQNKLTNNYQIQLQKIQKTLALKVKRLYDDERDRELLVLRRLQGNNGHPNIINLNHFFITQQQNQQYLNILTEFIPMNLSQLINLYKSNHKEIPQLLIKVFAYQLFRALAYMHELKVMHRNLSTENLLVNPKTFELKICGFGSAKYIQRGEQSLSQVGNRQYRAPEQLLGSKSYNQTVDLWAVGCILVELQTQNVLFEGNNTEDLGTPTDDDLKQMQGAVKELKLPNIKPLQWESTLNLKNENPLLLMIKKLLQYKPNHRGQAFDYLLSDYFKELQKPNLKLNGTVLPQIFNLTHGIILMGWIIFIMIEELKFTKYKENIQRLVPHWIIQVEINEEDLESMLHPK